ncbi:hypothetical protein [Lacrimispora brassicae]
MEEDEINEAIGPTGPIGPAGISTLIGGTVTYTGASVPVNTSTPITFTQNTLQGITFVNNTTTLTIVTAGYYYFDWQVSTAIGMTPSNTFGLVINSIVTNTHTMTSNSTGGLCVESDIISLSTGDTIQLYNLSADNKAIAATTGTVVARLSLYWISS